MQNAKGALQELFQGRGGRLPIYQTHCAGSPLEWQSRVTVVWGGRELTEEAVVKGKKKDAEKAVAEKMLQRLQNERATPLRRAVGSPTVQAESLSPTGRVSLAGEITAFSPRSSPSVSPASRGASTPARVRTSPMYPSMARERERTPPPRLSPLSPASSPARSPISVLQERLQKLSLALPRYTEVEGAGLSLVPSFQYRCVVHNVGRQPVLEVVGRGPSKQRAKEDAAERMLERFNGCWNSGSFATLPSLHPAAVPLPDIVDADLDDAIAIQLSLYLPQYHTLEEGGQFFCLAWSTALSDLPVAAHGRGDSEGVAKRQASCNLLANLAALSP